MNTADDELYPALSPDGRHLVFTRMRLLPQLNGNIVPPAARTLIHVDPVTGALLRDDAVTTLSDSIPFTVKRSRR